MRIISGIHKGRKITAPKNLPIRPTTDMAKEALFNILRHRIDIHGAVVLELFAGSGNMSYEFCSRGAAQCTAVDKHAACVNFIDKTAQLLDLPIQAYKAEAFTYLSKLKNTYDIIFADPPYALEEDEFLQIPKTVFENNLLTADGLLIVEHSKHSSLKNHPQFSSERRYGGTVFSFFEWLNEEE